MNPYDKFIEKDGDVVKRNHIVYMDHVSEKLLCDGCDRERQLAHIQIISGDVTGMCEECLLDILNEFRESKLDDLLDG